MLLLKVLIIMHQNKVNVFHRLPIIKVLKLRAALKRLKSQEIIQVRKKTKKRKNTRKTKGVTRIKMHFHQVAHQIGVLMIKGSTMDHQLA